MTPDQIKRLTEVYGRLVEAAIVEADPDHWTGAGKTPSEMDKTERGDRAWDKKSASLSLQLVSSARTLLSGGSAVDESERTEELIEKARREADNIIDRIEKRARHREQQSAR